ncbi:putative AB hydrolase-1 domain-containing protein [Seiridium cardinale]
MAEQQAKAASAEVDALIPNDPRVQHLDAKIGAYNYHYMLSTPQNPVATILLIHGWPDLGMAWRYQIPFLTSLGLRVIAPDLLGYGKTSAPAAKEDYAHKKICGQLKQLVEQVIGEGEKFLVGGHDWGAAVAWRMGLWHPDLVISIFSLNVPYYSPNRDWVPFEMMLKAVPSFKYQGQLASPVAEGIIDSSPERLRQFINGMYGGSGPNGERMFSPAVGIIEENLDKIGPAKLMSQDMVDYYVQEYSRNGLHGPTNWYRLRDLNFEDEKPLAEIEGGWKYKIPAMVVMGEKDPALPPSMADGMEKWFENGLKKELARGSGHWAMWQDPMTINKYIGEFLGSVLGDKVKGKL